MMVKRSIEQSNAQLSKSLAFRCRPDSILLNNPMSSSKSRKSRAVPLTILTAVALATTTACNDRRKEVRDCVDAQNHIVPDSSCQAPSGSGGGGGYHYIYGGASGGNIGDTVSGGSSAPDPGAEVVSESVARGGLGHGGDGHGGGGEGE
jgi:hypothetical protein